MSTPKLQSWDLPSPPASTEFNESWRMAGYHPLSPQEAQPMAVPSPYRDPNSEGFTSSVMAESTMHVQNAPTHPWSPQMQYSSFAHTPVQECAYLPSPVSVSTSPYSPQEFKSSSPADRVPVFQPRPTNHYIHSTLASNDWNQPPRQLHCNPYAGFLSPHLSLSSSSSRSSSSLSSAASSHYPSNRLSVASTPPSCAKAPLESARASESPEASSGRPDDRIDDDSDGYQNDRSSPAVPAHHIEDSSKQPPYAIIIYEALMSIPDRRMVLADIYNYFRWRMPARAARDGGWKNSIRHNLSMNGAFIKEARHSNDNVKRYIWVLSKEAQQNGVRSTTRYRRTAPRATKRLQNARRKVATRSMVKKQAGSVPMSPPPLRNAGIEWPATSPPLTPTAVEHPREYENAARGNSSRGSNPYSPSPHMNTPPPELELDQSSPSPRLSPINTTGLGVGYTALHVKEELTSPILYTLGDEPTPEAFKDTVFTDNAVLVCAGGEWHEVPWPDSPATSLFEEEYNLIRESSCNYSECGLA